jgi:hypothetical protein
MIHTSAIRDDIIWLTSYELEVWHRKNETPSNTNNYSDIRWSCWLDYFSNIFDSCGNVLKNLTESWLRCLKRQFILKLLKYVYNLVEKFRNNWSSWIFITKMYLWFVYFWPILINLVTYPSRILYYPVAIKYHWCYTDITMFW